MEVNMIVLKNNLKIQCSSDSIVIDWMAEV